MSLCEHRGNLCPRRKADTALISFFLCPGQYSARVTYVQETLGQCFAIDNTSHPQHCVISLFHTTWIPSLFCVFIHGKIQQDRNDSSLWTHWSFCPEKHCHSASRCQSRHHVGTRKSFQDTKSKIHNYGGFYTWFYIV